MLDVVDFTPAHAKLFDLDKFGEMLFVSVGQVMVERVFAEYSKPEQPAFTIFSDGIPLVCAGVWIWDLSHEPRTGEGWAIVNHVRGREEAFKLTKAVIRGLDVTQRVNNIARVHAPIPAENKRACRWAELLGFKQECLMRKWLCGRDHYLYARIYDA